jgi:uncharacterized protein
MVQLTRPGNSAMGTDNRKTQKMGGSMDGRSISDPDGNVLEVMWMDVDRAMTAWAAAS